MLNKHTFFKRFTGIVTSLFVLAAVSAHGQSASLQIKGSDTMVHLMSNLAESYMTSHPSVSIAVTGGGSGTGIAALLNGTTDICASSRAMKDKEITLAESKKIHPMPTIIGMDGLAVMANPANPVNELTMEQLKKIYTGEYTRWSEVGGPDQPIILLSRESNSGTYVYFQEHVLEKADFSPKARLMPSTAAIAQSAQEDKWAIGYGGVAYAAQGGVKTIKIKATPESAGVVPSEATVHDGSYPIARPLFLYTNGEMKGVVKDFIDFCLTDDGQNLVVETGYIPVKR